MATLCLYDLPPPKLVTAGCIYFFQRRKRNRNRSVIFIFDNFKKKIRVFSFVFFFRKFCENSLVCRVLTSEFSLQQTLPFTFWLWGILSVRPFTFYVFNIKSCFVVNITKSALLTLNFSVIVYHIMTSMGVIRVK